MTKELDESQIAYLENWAENKRLGFMTDDEKKVVKSIERMSKNEWKGQRKKQSKEEQMKQQLEMLRRKV